MDLLSKRYVSSVSSAVLVLLAGCGGDVGPKRYELTGEVTYRGQPVPVGLIIFEPDAASGNSGPGAMADIEDGRYRTRAGKGTVGGPHIVRITAGDGTNISELAPYGGYLGNGEHRLKADLPSEDSEKDFGI